MLNKLNLFQFCRVEHLHRSSRAFCSYRVHWTVFIFLCTIPRKAVSERLYMTQMRCAQKQWTHHFLILQGIVYNDTLKCVQSSFPQYVRELEGIADGAQVEFHKVNVSDDHNELLFDDLLSHVSPLAIPASHGWDHTECHLTHPCYKSADWMFDNLREWSRLCESPIAI